MTPIRVLLADDHDLVRAGIRVLLQHSHGIEVVAEASDGREALRLIGTHQPDVVLMDIIMPEMNGLEVVTRIRDEFPHVHAIVLSMHTSERYVLQAVRVGVAGYLLKGARAAELEQAITTVAGGGTYFSPAVFKHFDNGIHASNNEVAIADPLEHLTPRQREILQLVVEGNTTREIANKLDISTKTVEMHRAQLMDRLGIYDIPGLVRFAIRNGIISADE
jgi:RNA polymerase sigma factor (sigma-70 family)